MVIEKDGFEDYTLGKDYGTYESGSVIRVDADRKKWLDENGYGKTNAQNQERLDQPQPEADLGGGRVVLRERPLRKKPPAELETPPNIPDLPVRET